MNHLDKIKDMEKDMFRYFLRKNYENVDISNDECDEIGKGFNAYLKEKCSEKTIKLIIPDNVMKLIMDSDHPLKQNGFHPALIIHFDEFLKSVIEQQQYI